jgi:hypothetical protein
MIEEMKMIEDLINTPVEDKKKAKEEARAALKNFFRVPLQKRYQMLTPTYRSKVEMGGWIADSREWEKAANPRYKVQKIVLRGGCLAYAETLVQTSVLGHSVAKTIKIGLVRESAPYSPDISAPYRINGMTVPPRTIK